MASSPSSSFMYALHIAMAALFGASIMAVSALYIDMRAFDRLMRLHGATAASEAKEYEEEEETDAASDDDQGADSGISDADDGNEDRIFYFRPSSSLPSPGLPPRWAEEEEEEKRGGSVRSSRASPDSSLRADLVPPGLPPLRIARDEGTTTNKSLSHSAPRTKLISVAGPSTLKSSANAFESVKSSYGEGASPPNGEGNIVDCDNGNGKFSLVDFSNVHDASANILDSSATSFGLLNGKCEAFVIRSHMSPTHGTLMMNPVVADNPRKDPEDVPIPLKAIPHVAPSGEEEEVHAMIQECLALRLKYVYRENVAPWMKETIPESDTPKMDHDPFRFDDVEPTAHHFQMDDGVIHVYASEDSSEDLFPVASSTTFFTDMHHVLRVVSTGNVRSSCHHRLRLLEEKFRLYLLENADREFLAQKSAPHRDFYNVRKVDTHVHHSACMNQKHLLRFIKSKLRKEPDEVVIFRDGKNLTLKEVFESLDLTGHDLNVDLLDVHADKSTFHRFDKFNLKYNPCGQSRLREIFLKQDNLIQGRFLAELTKEVLSDLEASKYQLAEYRISIYGREQSEWDQLASWFVNNKIYSKNAVWLIQLPRLYNIYREMGIVTSFQDVLDNVFIPLFEVTVNPGSHPQLHMFLKQVVGFDMVDDESKPERRPTKHMPKPAEWTNEFNPAYSYYAYYCYANLYTLNKLRESKGMTTIRFRPHCGEAGDIDHLAAAFLLTHNIAHGINLRKSPVLQYLYYLAQIGMAMSPLSNNSLFLDYHRNPFPMFFQRGLNVSLSSDDPLQLHLTKEPLVEEYSVAAQVWKLSACDLCEIARNSLYQSGFPHAAKSHWLGNKYFKRGPEGNDIQKTNVPLLRIAFRHETWREEMQYVYSGRVQFPEDIDP
ncbi:hypothetical protein MRB53_006813 [Persea americana]|uniref:Uncharacterized protein n=1 Tax=Persea americana TaxID=3435 RepID=A0ACC2MI16_PERAE|nr:hypothetical protein MRB53_006813 [Persea americana]